MSSPQDQPPQQHPEFGQAYDPYGGRDPYNNRGFDIPYANGLPGEPQPRPVRRPGVMIGAIVLLVVGALPWFLIGLSAIVAPITADAIAATGLLDAPELKNAGVTADMVTAAVRVVGVLFVVVPVVYIVFSVLAFTGRNWARVLVAVVTGVLLVFLVLGMVGGGGVAGGAGVVVLLALIPAVGVGLMFTAAANAWFASLRK